VVGGEGRVSLGGGLQCTGVYVQKDSFVKGGEKVKNLWGGILKKLFVKKKKSRGGHQKRLRRGCQKKRWVSMQKEVGEARKKKGVKGGRGQQ